jgi:hypothetical protein
MSNVANITIRESIYIDAPVQRVWDYTQDWGKRSEWDPSVAAIDGIEEEPVRMVRFRAKGGARFAFQYKLYDPPHKTSGTFVDLRSAIFAGGGGAWEYAASGEGTQFSAVAALRLKRWVSWLLGALVRWSLRRQTRKALRRAKGILES